jgi:hypothetical protein
MSGRFNLTRGSPSPPPHEGGIDRQRIRFQMIAPTMTSTNGMKSHSGRLLSESLVVATRSMARM